MRLSAYFRELHEGYQAELDDLRWDTDGRDVLQSRLRDKRREMPAIVPMIEVDPLMLAPTLHGAFRIPAGRVAPIEALLGLEPDEFPSWAELAAALSHTDWAQPLIELALAQDGGETFLATVVGLEYMHVRTTAASAASAQADEDAGEDEEDRDREAGDGDDEADDDRDDDGGRGDDFLEQQGFDRRSE
jgi:hypothetical protein